jgi:hypothetical protein
MDRNDENAVMNSLVAIAMGNAMREFTVNIILAITQKSPYLVFRCKNLFAMAEAAPLVGVLVNARANDEMEAFQVFASALGIAGKDRLMLVNRILKILPRLEGQSQVEFVAEHGRDVDIVIAICLELAKSRLATGCVDKLFEGIMAVMEAISTEKLAALVQALQALSGQYRDRMKLLQPCLVSLKGKHPQITDVIDRLLSQIE